MNVRHPGACVGGQTELQPRIVDLIQGRVLSQVAPERCSAASGGTSGNFLFGGIHPRTGQYYTHYHFEGNGWGGRARTDGNNCQICPHGNCRNTPVEVFETRYPWFTECYRLNADAGGPGRTRGGLGITRLLHVEADEIVVSALCDRSKVAPWGVYGGHDGDRLAYLVRTAGSSRFQYLLARHSARPATRSSRTCDSTVATSSCCGRRPGVGTAPRGSGHRSTSPRTWWRGTSLASAPQPATASSSGRTAPSIRPVPSARGPS